jgi:hypothetical protein
VSETETKERKPATIDIDDRWAKAISDDIGPVIPKGSGIYFVVSRRKDGPNKVYRVRLKGRTVRQCQCAYGSIHRQSACKHVLAAARYAAVEKGYQAVWPVPEGYDWKAKGYDGVFNLGEGFVLLVSKLER